MYALFIEVGETAHQTGVRIAHDRWVEVRKWQTYVDDADNQWMCWDIKSYRTKLVGRRVQILIEPFSISCMASLVRRPQARIKV